MYKVKADKNKLFILTEIVLFYGNSHFFWIKLLTDVKIVVKFKSDFLKRNIAYFII